MIEVIVRKRKLYYAREFIIANKIIKILPKDPKKGLSCDDLASGVSGHRTNVYDALRILKDKGFIGKTTSFKTGRPVYVYYLRRRR